MNIKATLASFCLLMSFQLRSANRLQSTETVIESPVENTFLTKTRQLTYAGERSGEGYFSADGQKMIFQSEREAGNPFYQMYLMDFKSGKTELVSTGEGRTTCGWLHPSGNSLLFSSSHEDPNVLKTQEGEYERRSSGQARSYSWDFDPFYEIYSRPVNNEAGEPTLTNLTNSPGYDAEAAWSPDGKWIVFSSNRSAYSETLSSEDQKIFEENPSYFSEIYLMRTDGSDLQRLTNTPGYDGGPFFSSDGQSITWRRFSTQGYSAEIMVMDLASRAELQVTHLGEVSWAPFFHPSGDYLIFASSLYGHDNFELFIVDVKGKHEPVRVTDSAGFDGLPVFRPGHQQLSWTSNRNGKSQIFLATWNDMAARRSLGLEIKTPRLSEFSPAIRVNDLKTQVEYLASWNLAGRGTGTEGEKLAAEFVESYFKNLGLEPAFPSIQGKSFMFPFEFEAGVAVAPETQVKISERSLELGKDFLPLNFSIDGQIENDQFVFAGYGLRESSQDEPAYDSYVHLDVKDKWVLVFRFLPEDIAVSQKLRLQRSSSLRAKAALAKSLGAKGIIVVSGPNAGVKKELVPLSENHDSARFNLLGLSVSDQVGADILGINLAELGAIQKDLDLGEGAPALAGSLSLSGHLQLNRQTKRGLNVVARLRASKDVSSQPALLLGAHLDHLGVGEEGEIYFGADDNASGVSAILELAHSLSAMKQDGLEQKHDLIFATWSGEEHGLLGSAAFVKQLDAGEGKAIEKIGAILNFDMIGRYRKSVVIQGVGSSLDWLSDLEEVGYLEKMKFSVENDPYLPTDSTSFYLQKIPGLQFFTGSHDDYHSPRDVAEKINYKGLKKIVNFAQKLSLELLASDELPRYNEISQGDTSTGPLRVSLGTVPDYTRSDIEGVLLSGVKSGSPADKAGILAGDIIVSLAGELVGNIYDYTRIIGALKANEEVEIKIFRSKESLTLKITPEARS